MRARRLARAARALASAAVLVAAGFGGRTRAVAQVPTAQVPTAQPPAAQPTPAPTAVRDTGTSSFEVGGMQVILRRVTANQVVAANLYLLGGTRQTPPEQAGLEPFLLEASEQGTLHYPRERLRTQMARLGTSIGVGADHDWTTLALRSTPATLDSTWAIFADRLMNPTLDSADVELVRAQLLGAVRQRRDDPDASLDYLADSVAYTGTPYAVAPVGTATSLAGLTIADLRRYQREQMVTSRMLLVVVGDVTREHLLRLVTTTIGTLPRGDYHWTPPTLPSTWNGALAVERRTLPTNYVLGYFPGAAAAGPDYVPLRIAAAVLSGRFFAEIRSKRNLSYAVDARFLERASGAAGLYVTTVDPRTTLRIMREELSNLQEGWITQHGLEQLTQHFITEYFLDNETNGDQANFLARAQLYRGDWHRASHFADELRAVTPADVRRVSRQYLHGLRLAYIGDPNKLDPGVVGSF
ncbi:MAG TPA: pitrilysin family protein [Gemmatirosa sp.]